MHNPHRDVALSRSCSAELWVHFAVLVLGLAPLIVVIFPALLALIAAVILTSAANQAAISDWIGDHRLLPALGASLCMLTIALGAAVRCRPSQARVKLRELAGADGARLCDVVRPMWQSMAGLRRPLTVKWFPALDIAAYAGGTSQVPELHVSAGLWRAALSGQPAAKAILAHELAHLKFRDPPLIALLRRMLAALRAATLVTAVIVLTALAATLVAQTIAMVESGLRVSEIALSLLLIFAGAATTVIFIPLGWFAVRRQIAFIHSLIEIRADVAGAAWTTGLREFTQAFASEEGRLRTGRRDLARAIISPQLTHIPERERLALLGQPALLATPKTRFFAFSLAAVFLLPLNFATPLLFGGAGNHHAMQALSAAFNAAIVLMLNLGNGEQPLRLPLARIMLLAGASIVITALPRINLEPVSYLAMSWIAGFGGTPADPSTLWQDVNMTARDLAEKFHVAVLNPSAVAALAAATSALWCLGRTSSVRSGLPRSVRTAILGAVALAASALAGFDPLRSVHIPFAARLLNKVGELGLHPSNLLAFPLAAACLVDLAILAVARHTKR